MNTKSRTAIRLAMVAALASPVVLFAATGNADHHPEQAAAQNVAASSMPANQAQMQARMQAMQARMQAMQKSSDLQARMPMMTAQMQDMQAMMKDMNTGCPMASGQGGMGMMGGAQSGMMGNGMHGGPGMGGQMGGMQGHAPMPQGGAH